MDRHPSGWESRADCEGGVIPQIGQSVHLVVPHIPEWNGQRATVVFLLPTTALEVRIEPAGPVVVVQRADVEVVG